MSSSLPQFEDAYAGRPLMDGVDEIPWNIGEPQPAIAALIADGRVRGEVLDVGCGVGETTLRLAELGHRAIGVDVAPSAIAQARDAARTRGVDCEFHVADVTTLSGFDGRFDTIIDCTLFHSLPVEARAPYLSAIARSAANGAVLHVLAFSADARFPEGVSPNCVTETELRGAVGEYWTVDSVAPASITVLRTGVFDRIATGHDERGRGRMPALLLHAHHDA